MSDRVTYGASGGSGSGGICPRCEQAINKHAVAHCDISDDVEGGVASLVSVSLSISGAKMKNRELMREARVGALKQDDFNQVADRMVGALVAQLHTGQTIKLVAFSGGKDPVGTVSGWEVADPDIPTGKGGWTDIYGRRFTMPAATANALGINGKGLLKPCAAIKLLLRLGEIAAASGKTPKYNFVSLYEEAFRGIEEDGSKSKKLAKWRGKDSVYVRAAHSCDQCAARVPILLCDGSE